MERGVVAGVVFIGFVHGVLPDHGWPIAASYALNRQRRWLYGAAAGFILGVGHLISSVVLVAAYFWFSRFAAFAEGPWLRTVAGVLLILLGIREYRHGGHGGGEHGHDHSDETHHDAASHHTHTDDHHEAHEHGNDPPTHSDTETGSHGHDHAPMQTDHSHHTHPPESDSLLTRIRHALPGGGGHQHLSEAHAERGLYALGMTALLLGFAHEEPIQILAICVGTPFCLELMLIYSLAVIVAILIPTLLLIAGYERHQDTVEKYTPYLPTITAVVLVGMGLAFVTGLL